MIKLISALTTVVVCALCSLSITFSCEDKEKFSLSSHEELIITDDVYATVDPAKPVIKGIDITVGNLVCLTQNQLKSQFNYSDDNNSASTSFYVTVIDVSIREYKSDNFLVDGVLKAFWELWDLFYEELFGGNE